MEIDEQELSDPIIDILSNLTAEHSIKRVFKPPDNATLEDVDTYLQAKETISVECFDSNRTSFYTNNRRCTNKLELSARLVPSSVI